MVGAQRWCCVVVWCGWYVALEDASLRIEGKGVRGEWRRLRDGLVGVDVRWSSQNWGKVR